ncbi:hypothetical protein G9A89_021660 [Geosiphon pyriformis]|nr:hypothetical protein G9A89_021660 [Geosiphon pyriformis]
MLTIPALQTRSHVINQPTTAALELALRYIESKSPLNLTPITNYIRQELIARFATIENWYTQTWLHKQLVFLGIPPLYISILLAIVLLATLRQMYRKSIYLLCNSIGVLYPAYRSIKVLDESAEKEHKIAMAEQKQWLTYWTIYGWLQIADYWSNWFLKFFPGYNFCKLVFLYWAQNDRSKGATIIFEHFVQPLLRNPPHPKGELRPKEHQIQQESTKKQANEITSNPHSNTNKDAPYHHSSEEIW